jgi:hypothetical protein
MHVPGAYIETILPPQSYSSLQLDEACRIAAALNRGKFVLCVQPPP